MPFSSYEIEIYDHEGQRVRRIPRILDFRAKLVRNDFSTAMAALVGVDALWARDYFEIPGSTNHIMVVRKNHPVTQRPVKIKSYFIRRFNPWVDEEGRFLYHIGGVSPEWLLTHRLLIPERDSRYVEETSRYITEAGVLSDVMADLVTYHIGELANQGRMYNISVVTHGTVGSGGGRWDFDVLMDVLQELARSDPDGVDFSMEYVPSDNQVLFHVGRFYRDRRKNNPEGNSPKIIAERLGNLSSPSLIYDAEALKNVLWIRQDEDEDDAERRLLIRIEGEGINIPWNIIEFENNNTRRDETDTKSKLITDGRALLKENEATIEFEMEFNNSIRNRFLVDWLLGDRFTVEFANHEFDFEISELEIEVTNGEETITPKMTRVERPDIEARNV